MSLHPLTMLLVVLLLVISTMPVQAAQYYIDVKNPLASDANPGTETEPWKTLAKGSSMAQAGDTVVIRGGVYQERLIPARSGTPGNEITYMSSPGEEVVLDASSLTIPAWSGLIYIDRSYIVISGLHLRNVYASGDKFDKYAGIWVGGADHVTIKNSYIYNTCGAGIQIRNANNIIIDGNELELNCNGCRGEIISLEKVSTFEVMNNYIHHGGLGYQYVPPASFGGDGGEGIDIKEGSCCGKVYNNKIHDLAEDMGIYIDSWDKHTHDIEVFGNIVFNSREGFTWGCEAGGLLENLFIHNNIAFNNQKYGFVVGGYGGGPRQNFFIINNVAFNNSMGGIYASNRDYKNVVIKNNILSQNKLFQLQIMNLTDEFDISHNLIDGFRGYDHEIYGEQPITGDPQFVSIAAPYDFYLRPTSPAIDAGISAGVLFDFDEMAVPQGVAPDIGAYEYKADKTSAKPLGENSKDIISTLLASLTDNDPRVRWAAVKALGQMGPRALSAVDAVVKTLADESPEVQIESAVALGNIGVGSVSILSALIRAMNDGDNTLHRAAFHAWASVITTNELPDAVPLLISALQDVDVTICSKAVELIGRSGPSAKVAVPVLATLLGRDDEQLRGMVVEALSAIGSIEAIPALLAALEDNNTGVRMKAIGALGVIGTDPAQDALRHVLKNRREELPVLQAAVSALRKIDPVAYGKAFIDPGAVIAIRFYDTVAGSSAKTVTKQVGGWVSDGRSVDSAIDGLIADLQNLYLEQRAPLLAEQEYLLYPANGSWRIELEFQNGERICVDRGEAVMIGEGWFKVTFYYIRISDLPEVLLVRDSYVSGIIAWLGQSF